MSTVNVNEYLTDTLSINLGVCHGDGLSPTIFDLYTNNLANALNDSGKGIQLNEHMCIALLMTLLWWQIVKIFNPS